MIISGVGIGGIIAPVTALGLRHVAPEDAGTAAGALNTVSSPASSASQSWPPSSSTAS